MNNSSASTASMIPASERFRLHDAVILVPRKAWRNYLKLRLAITKTHRGANYGSTVKCEAELDKLSDDKLFEEMCRKEKEFIQRNRESGHGNSGFQAINDAGIGIILEDFVARNGPHSFLTGITVPNTIEEYEYENLDTIEGKGNGGVILNSKGYGKKTSLKGKGKYSYNNSSSSGNSRYSNIGVHNASSDRKGRKIREIRTLGLEVDVAQISQLLSNRPNVNLNYKKEFIEDYQQRIELEYQAAIEEERIRLVKKMEDEKQINKFREEMVEQEAVETAAVEELFKKDNLKEALDYDKTDEAWDNWGCDDEWFNNDSARQFELSSKRNLIEEKEELSEYDYGYQDPSYNSSHVFGGCLKAP